MTKSGNRLLFKDPKTPYSPEFDDIYFSSEEGVKESTYVYLEGSGVLAAIREKKSVIRIGEVGFGVGLNFILTLQAFNREATTEQTLHYVSAEKFPVPVEDLTKLYEAYPELFPTAKLLFDQYPILTPGLHRLTFLNGRVRLDLLIGDAREQFTQIDFVADFWYWDGFAPSKNPDAFSSELFEQIKLCSSVGACGASFTVAGWVRRSLEEAGFQVRKRPGFGKKRECLIALLKAEASTQRSNRAIPAWFSRERYSLLNAKSSVAVLGAGLAGSAIARALADRGHSVVVYDGNGIANRASSNTAGLFNVQMSKKPNPISRFAQISLTHFLRELKQLELPHQLGILRKDADAKQCLDALSYPPSFYESREDGVFLPFCGFINPSILCTRRLQSPLIKVVKKMVNQVKKNEDGFLLLNSLDEILGHAEHVVYAMGADVALGVSDLRHSFFENLPMRAIRGQTLLVAPTPLSQEISYTRVEEGYITPIQKHITGHHFHVVGATYQAKDVQPNQLELDTVKLIAEAKTKWQDLGTLTRSSVVEEKVGFRASTPDKLPLIGPLFDSSWLRANYKNALKGAKLKNLEPLETSPNEWLFMGLGSRGITFSSLGAEILACLMTGDTLPIETELFYHLHPARFHIRQLKRVAF